MPTWWMVPVLEGRREITAEWVLARTEKEAKRKARAGFFKEHGYADYGDRYQLGKPWDPNRVKTNARRSE